MLAIAGSDSGGAAGIQADIQAIAAQGAFAATAITAITAQNSLSVRGVWPQPPHVVAAQIAAVLVDLPVRAVKIGVLANGSIVHTVADALGGFAGPVVLDPVTRSTSGRALLEPDGVAALIERLLPRATLVTPNLPEAAALAGRSGAQEAAARICAMGARAVLVKGGHGAPGPTVSDLLYDRERADGERVEVFTGPRIDTPHTRGTGCALASAIAAQLALGLPLREAVAAARRYLEGAIRRGGPVGSGPGALGLWGREEG